MTGRVKRVLLSAEHRLVHSLAERLRWAVEGWIAECERASPDEQAAAAVEIRRMLPAVLEALLQDAAEADVAPPSDVAHPSPPFFDLLRVIGQQTPAHGGRQPAEIVDAEYDDSDGQ